MGDLLDQTIADNKLMIKINSTLMCEINHLKSALVEEKEDVNELEKNLHQKEQIISGFIKKTFQLAVNEEKYNIMREFITMCDLEDDFKTYLDSVELAFMFDD